MDGATSSVALPFQRLDSSVQRRQVPHRLRQAPALEGADLDFGHVEPTVMLGRVVQLKPAGNPTGCGRWEHQIQTGQGVGIEVLRLSCISRMYAASG